SSSLFGFATGTTTSAFCGMPPWKAETGATIAAPPLSLRFWGPLAFGFWGWFICSPFAAPRGAGAGTYQSSQLWPACRCRAIVPADAVLRAFRAGSPDDRPRVRTLFRCPRIQYAGRALQHRLRPGHLASQAKGQPDDLPSRSDPFLGLRPDRRDEPVRG